MYSRICVKRMLAKVWIYTWVACYPLLRLCDKNCRVPRPILLTKCTSRGTWSYLHEQHGISCSSSCSMEYTHSDQSKGPARDMDTPWKHIHD